MKRILLILSATILLCSCSEKTILHNSAPNALIKNNAVYDYYLGEAIRSKYLGTTSNAIELFEQCKKLDPERTVPYYELAQIYAGEGFAEKALENIRTAAFLDKENYWYQLACASFYLEYNQTDTAIVYFEKAHKIAPYAREAVNVLAELYFKSGADKKADSLFVNLSEYGSLDERDFFLMISALLREKRFDDAAKRTIVYIESHPSELKYKALLGQIYDSMGDVEKCDSIYREIIESDPEGAEAQLYSLINLFNKKEYKNADKFIGNIFRSDAIEKERKISLAMELLDDSTYINVEKDRVDENFRILEEKLPDDEEVLSLRPLLYEKTNQTDKAIVLYKQILEKVRPGFYFKERLILLYAEMNMYDELFILSQNYSKENNLSLIAKVYYAISAMQLKNYTVADEELNKCLILAGNDNTLQVQILNMLAEVKYLMGDTENSFAVFEKIIELKPDDIVALNNYAYYLAEQNEQLDKAEDMISRVLESEPDNPTYLDTYAWILYRTEKYRKALAVMERIIDDNNAEDSEIYEHMGFILMKMSKCSKAVVYWEKALNLDNEKNYLKEEIEKCKGE